MMHEEDSRSSAEAQASRPNQKGFLARFMPLWPYALGLACARTGLAVATSGSYKSTDDGVFSDGSMLVALVPLVVLGIVLFKSERTFSQKTAGALCCAAAIAQTLLLVVMGLMRLTDNCTFPLRFALSALSSFATLVAMGCWLRGMRNSCMVPAAVMVFSALFASEIPVFATTLLPDGARCLAISPIVACQVLCALWARRVKAKPEDIEAPRRADDYFAFMRGNAVTRRFLVSCAVGIATMSLVVGFLRGFPDGQPIPFLLTTRTAAFVLVELVCVLFVVSVLRQRTRTMTVAIWVFVELLAALTLVLYTAFPGRLDIGAVSIVLLSAIMTAFMWYLVIAFMASGWREPFYYAICILCIWVSSRAIGRFVLIGVMPIGGDHHFTGSVISLLLLVSTQLILVKLLDVAHFANKSAHATLPDEAAPHSAEGSDDADAKGSSAIDRILGLDDRSAVRDVQRAAMQHRADTMGRQFLLSEREVEVLALYASGMTQKRVAETLHISTTTAHTHIGRIYSKTGLHSRQEIIDYLEQYADK